MEVPTLASNQLVPINVKEQEFQKIMRIYEMAMTQVKDDLENAKNSLSNFYQYDVINNINCRVMLMRSSSFSASRQIVGATSSGISTS